jgi:hypothetical protein
MMSNRKVDSFDQLEATLLLCPKCRRAMPVRKRLLLVLSEGEKFDYICTACGSICGDKIERPPPDQPRTVAWMPPRSRRPRR